MARHGAGAWRLTGRWLRWHHHVVKSRRPTALPIVLLALAPLTLSACVRLDLPPQEHPALDAAQAQRQEAAVSAAVLADAARRAAAGAEDHVATVLQQIAEQADTQREALGDVWVAWPDGAPEGVSVPEPPDTVDESVTDAHGVLNLLHADWAAQRAAALSADTPKQQRAGYVGVTVSRAAQATALAGVIGVPVPDATDPMTVPGASGPDGALAAAPLATFPGTNDGDAVAILDSARYGLETAAARSTEPVRTLAAQQAKTLTLISQTMVGEGAPDERRAVWASGDAGAQGDATQMARESLASALPLWVLAAVETDPASRPDSDTPSDEQDESVERANKAGGGADGNGGGAVTIDPSAVYLDGACRTVMTLVQLGVPLTDPTLGPMPGVAEMETVK